MPLPGELAGQNLSCSISAILQPWSMGPTLVGAANVDSPLVLQGGPVPQLLVLVRLVQQLPEHGRSACNPGGLQHDSTE